MPETAQNSAAQPDSPGTSASSDQLAPTHQSNPAAASTFDEVFAAVADVSGWMTEGQARMLWRNSRLVQSPGSIVEIGSYQGRSTVVLASAAAQGVQVVAIDPHAGNDRGPNEIAGYEDEAESDNAAFHRNLKRAGVSDRVRHVRAFSSDAISEVPGGIDLLYIDGAHRFRPALDDIRSWGAKVNVGGTLLIHDSFNAVGVMAAQVAELFAGTQFSYVGRSESMAEYRRLDLSRGQRAASFGRQARELPYFLWCCGTKAMIKLGASEATKKLGNPSGEWPY